MTAKKVLVVDDAQSVRQQVGHALTQAGFEVMEAVDGVDALERITETPELAGVICDINMPRMNGVELLELLRAKSLRPMLPIVVLTTEGQPDLMRRAKAAGAKGWIVKPFKADLLIAAIKRLIA